MRNQTNNWRQILDKKLLNLKGETWKRKHGDNYSAQCRYWLGR